MIKMRALPLMQALMNEIDSSGERLKAFIKRCIKSTCAWPISATVSSSDSATYECEFDDRS